MGLDWMYICSVAGTDGTVTDTEVDVDDIVEDTYYRGKDVVAILDAFYDGFVNCLDEDLAAEANDCYGVNDLLTDDQISKIIKALEQIADQCEKEPEVCTACFMEICEVADISCLCQEIQEIICFLQQKEFVKDTMGREVNIHCWY